MMVRLIQLLHRKADLTFNLNWNTIEKRNRLKQQKNLIRSSKGRVIAWLWPCPHMCFNSPIKFWTISAVKTNKKSHKKKKLDQNQLWKDNTSWWKEPLHSWHWVYSLPKSSSRSDTKFTQKSFFRNVSDEGLKKGL